jgi:hypothetical protein
MLIGNFRLHDSIVKVDIKALAARYQTNDFWLRFMTDLEGEGPQ